LIGFCLLFSVHPKMDITSISRNIFFILFSDI
jgi:hypothetical protein